MLFSLDVYTNYIKAYEQRVETLHPELSTFLTGAVVATVNRTGLTRILKAFFQRCACPMKPYGCVVLRDSQRATNIR